MVQFLTALSAKETVQQSTIFKNFNNGGSGGKIPHVHQYVNMGLPCPIVPPTNHANSITEWALEDIEDNIDAQGIEAEGFEASKSHGKNKQNSHHRKTRNQRKNKHPYQDRCVDVGEFCGSKMYGCNFAPHALFTCAKIGDKPIVKDSDSDKCKGSAPRPPSATDPPVVVDPPPPSLGDPSSPVFTLPDIVDPPSSVVIPSDIVVPSPSAISRPSTVDSPSSAIKPPSSVVNYPTSIVGPPSSVVSSPTSIVSPPPSSTVKTRPPVSNYPVSGTVPTYSIVRPSSVPVTRPPSSDTKPSSLVTKSRPLTVASSSAIVTPTSVVEPPSLGDIPSLPGTAPPSSDGCTCLRNDAVCGHQLPAACNGDPNTIYHCPGGVGTYPEILRLCNSGSLCQASPDGFDSICGYANCKCSGTDQACSAQFPEHCNLQKNAQYTCSFDGVLDLVSTCAEGNSCSAIGDKDTVCEPERAGPDGPQCKCPRDGILCGEHFPLSCRLPANALYACTKDGVPVLHETCTARRCSITPGSQDEICYSECSCSSKGLVRTMMHAERPSHRCADIPRTRSSHALMQVLYLIRQFHALMDAWSKSVTTRAEMCQLIRAHVCGKDFPPSCGLSEETLYLCTTVGAKVLNPVPCPRGCEVLSGDDKCLTDTVPAKDECICAVSGAVCGSVFPKSCNFEKDSLYTCSRAGAKPNSPTPCTIGCFVEAGGDRCIDEPVAAKNPCACITAGQVCGKEFPESCGYESETLYTCAAAGDIASNPIACIEGCQVLPGDDHCIKAVDVDVKVDTCFCPDSGDFCGSAIPGCQLPEGELYSCAEAGAKPVWKEHCDNHRCIVEGRKDDYCASKCTCLSDEPVCGADIAEACQGYPSLVDTNAIYFCPLGQGSIPELLRLCQPGSICQKNSHDGVACGGSDCECSGTDEVCSNTFPSDCGATANSIYRCGSDGKRTLVKTCEDGTTCTPVTGGSICAPSDCTCRHDGVVCGEVFPLHCRIRSTALYHCIKGEKPVFSSDCEAPTSGRCVSNVLKSLTNEIFTSQDAEECVDCCLCTGKGLVCGRTFPSQCGYDTTAMYTCAGQDEIPTNPTVCPTKICVVRPGDDTCGDGHECKCPDNDSVCGHAFPGSCGFEADTLYRCPGGAQSTPVTDTKCLSGICLVVKGHDVCGDKVIDPCLCTETGNTCGASFPSVCNLSKSSLYTCIKGNHPTLVASCPAPASCVGSPGSAVCLKPVDECVCTNDKDRCGSSFPASCNYNKNSLYTCRPGEKPTNEMVCEFDCIVDSQGQDDDACESPAPLLLVHPCMCVEDKNICGAQFPEFCGFDSGTLYSCQDGAGSDPVVLEVCKSGFCLAQEGDDICSPAKSSDCFCKDEHDACGSAFDDSCQLGRNTLYQCQGGAGAKPLPATVCDHGCVIHDQSDDQCQEPPANPCVCVDATAPCGFTFPEECGYKSHALYSCADGPGSVPKDPQDCPTGLCIQAPSDDKCQPLPPIDCLCANSFDVCGKVYPVSCRFDTTILYDCSGGVGSKPTPKEQCKISCGIQVEDDKCTNPCLCPDEHNICGSMFPVRCGFNSTTLYKCTGGAGSLPHSPEVCNHGVCHVQEGHDVCPALVPGDCLCIEEGQICGSLYPLSCNFGKDTLYTCQAAGAKPVAIELCGAGCQVNTIEEDACKMKPLRQPDPCVCVDNTDVCSGTFPASCNFEANTLYQCTDGVGSVPKTPYKCPVGICLVAPGNDICQPPPPVDCKCKDELSVCGKIYPESCGYLQTGLYACKGAGETPQLLSNCTLGCYIEAQGHDQCALPPPPTFNPCVCPFEGVFCDARFGDTCNLEPNSLYSCTGFGAKPEKKEACSNGICIWYDDGDVCPKPPPTDCKCRDAFDICGSVFPVNCSFDSFILYKCDSAGTIPTLSQNCTHGCEQRDENDRCTVVIQDVCKCQDNLPVCGKAFPASCGLAPESLYLCPGGKGSDPTTPVVCNSGECEVLADIADVCKIEPEPVDCTCKDDLDVCGFTFPPECQLQNQTLYKCGKQGDTPTVGEVCTEGCKENPQSDECIQPKCICAVTGVVCGSELPAHCLADPNRKYDCRTGEIAKPMGSCLPGTLCIPGTPFPTCGASTCSCIGSVSVCSSSLPASCNLLPNTVYKCTPSGVAVVQNECAADTECTVVSDGAICARKDCKCSTDGSVCGSAFAPSCNYPSNALLTCKTGEPPGSPVQCPDGGGCTSVIDAFKSAAVFKAMVSNDVCTDECLCFGIGEMCGSTWPARCGFPKGTLYKCDAHGATPTELEKCEDDVCTVTVSDDHCGGGVVLPESCFCADDKPFCGSRLGPECEAVLGVKPELHAIYACSGVGQIPVKQETCKDGEVCHEEDAGPICIPQECLCTDDGSHCGLVLPATCGLVENTLYKCTNGKRPTVTEDCLPGVCSANLTGATKTGTDKCIKQCECKGAENVCSSTFAAECNLPEKTLYRCTAVGAVPELEESCTLDCDIKDGADECRLNPCACTKAGDTCGVSFPPECNLDVRTLFKCAGKGKLPTTSPTDVQCQDTERCISVPGGSDICGPSNDCECIGNGTFCLDLLQPACNLKENGIRTCPDNTTTLCALGCANGECKTDCTCTKDGDRCGSSFARSCGLLPNSLYTCTVGGTPVLKEACGDNVCTSGVSADSCSDPCKCIGTNDVCGASFPPSCNIAVDAVYKCSGVGAEPSDVKACTKGCMFTLTDNSCKLDCPVQLLIDTIQGIMPSLRANVSTLTNMVYPVVADYLTTILTDMEANQEKAAKLSVNAAKLKSAVVYASQLIAGLDSIKPTPEALEVAGNLNITGPLIDAVMDCAGRAEDCTSPKILFNKISAEIRFTMANEALKPPPINAESIATTMNHLKAFPDLVDAALVSKLQSDADAAMALVHTALGGVYIDPMGMGEVTGLTLLLRDSADQALECVDLKPLGVCEIGDLELAEAIRVLREHVELDFYMISVVASAFMDPLSTTLTKLLEELKNSTDPNLRKDIASVFFGFQQFMNSQPPGDEQEKYQGFLNYIVNMTSYIEECGGLMPDCDYFTQDLIMVQEKVIQSLSTIPPPRADNPIRIAYNQIVALTPRLKTALEDGPIGQIDEILAEYAEPLSQFTKTSGGQQAINIMNYMISWATEIRDCLDDEGVRPKA
ncbi:hypothetical protein BGZ94_003656 [Podila epigama]|nr:hypothetical protein BGZ94_003656 [Podila epigama]